MQHSKPAFSPDDFIAPQSNHTEDIHLTFHSQGYHTYGPSDGTAIWFVFSDTVYQRAILGLLHRGTFWGSSEGITRDTQVGGISCNTNGRLIKL